MDWSTILITESPVNAVMGRICDWTARDPPGVPYSLGHRFVYVEPCKVTPGGTMIGTFV